MGLLPLEFTECLQDSPFFRDSLQSHEKELERTSQNIKDLIKEVKNLLNAAKTVSAAQRRLSQHLINFKFECIGNNQTDDEILIATSLKEFGKLIAAIEGERDRMLERAYEQFIEPLESFRKDNIGAVKERKKKFEKQTAKFCASQERYLSLSTKKQDNVLQEADASLEMEQRDFIRAGLEYVCLIQEVQERKKFEFVEILLGFMYSWLTFYHQGHEVAQDYKPQMTELQTRIQKTRENFDSSRQDIQALMRKMLEIRNTKPIDPGTLNKVYTRTGYLFLMEKKALGTSWMKCFCQYQREGRVFCMIPYNQTAGKIVSTETIRLKTCVRRVSDSIDKRFCFDITAEDKPGVVYTLQALSEEDRRLWIEAMEGTEPMYVHPPKPSNADQTYLDEGGFNFVTRCFQVLENRGLEDQGLYRVVGVASKVTKLLTMGLDKRKSEKLNLDDNTEWESKTITSAIKTFFRNLPEPIMTFRLHSSFIAAAKLETPQQRVSEIHRLVQQLPEPNKRMLELLCQHLERVAGNAGRNMMTVSNLGVCFGPTLLRNEEETVAAIMDIKFGNVVVEILIENWRQVICNETPPPDLSPRRSTPQLTVLPLEGARVAKFTPSPRSMVSPPQHRQPPPYPHPPPPPAGATLAHAVIYNNGPKQVQITNKSPPPTSNHSYNSATWERTLRMGGANLVPPPLGSAPAPGTSSHHHRTVHASLSNLSSASSSLSNVPSSSNSSRNHLAHQHPYQHQSTEEPPWYNVNKVPAKVMQLQRQLSAGHSSSSFGQMGGSSRGRPSFETDPDASRAADGDTSSILSEHSAAFSTSPRGFKAEAVAPSSQDSSSSSLESLTSGSSKEPAAAASPKASEMQPDKSPNSVAAQSSQVARLRPTRSFLAQTNKTPATELRKVRTLYACVGEHESELSFEPNQIITSVRSSLEPGWLEGCLDGKVGLIPENYVEYL